ncbi:MAG: 50S ribosomal protein L5, partial [Polyangiales bacterium]
MSEYEPRLRKKYKEEIVPQLMKDFSFRNIMQVPKLERVIVNMGLGEAVQNAKLIESAVEELRAITGRKPIVTRAKKSIASFKLREGMPIGVMVTLRGEQMYDFVDRLVSIALPRTRDFKGISPKAF